MIKDWITQNTEAMLKHDELNIQLLFLLLLLLLLVLLSCLLMLFESESEDVDEMFDIFSRFLFDFVDEAELVDDEDEDDDRVRIDIICCFKFFC